MESKNERTRLNKNIKLKIKKQEGITLVAVVVTIIVLIILAGLSISLVLGENGIISKAKYAKQETLNSQVVEQEQLNEVAAYLENMGEAKAIEELKGGEYFNKKTTVKDSDGNLIEVPKGFKIAEDSGDNVTEGIVIEDNDIIEGIGNNRGNQYVWIPVGTGIKKADNTTVDITLGRYIFANGNHKDEEGNVLAKGTPILMQNAESYSSEKEIHITDINPTSTLDYGYKELATSRIGTNTTNTTALNLKGFIDSVKSNGGYYIARYEASYGADGKANSKVSNDSNDASSAPTTEGALWNNIRQIDSAVASRDLYTTATTDLINSYAWDTAIVYIQKFSGDEDYSYQASLNSELSNTGKLAENVKDEKCKINDMSSNAYEWTTEYSSYTEDGSIYTCTRRGGLYITSSYYTGFRDKSFSINKHKNIAFRLELYM